MNVTFNPNDIKTAEEAKAFRISKKVIGDCENAADVLRNVDNTSKDTCEIKGIVTTEDYVKKHFFSRDSVDGSLVYDKETGKTKTMDARTMHSEFAFSMGSFVRQEVREKEVFFQSAEYIVHMSNDGATLSLETDPNIGFFQI